MSVPLVRRGQLVGYLQLQHPTQARDQATRHFAFAMALTSPLILICLGIAGHYFASRAVQPVEESMRVLKQFIADAGHELSTPISIIQANAEAIDEELEDSGIPAGRLDVITRSTERMSNLVDDLMVLARTTSPRLLSATTQCKFHEIVTAIVQEFAQLFKEKGIDLKSSDIQECPMYGNPEGLKKLLSNLLSNALRYTDSGGTVTVSLSQDGHHAHLQVADTGIGIPQEALASIFERFYRVDKSRSRAAGGSGLGLAIVKAIVLAHHGKIEVDSKVGEGSRFLVVLPLRS
jgi:signal transduction histidine kinase